MAGESLAPYFVASQRYSSNLGGRSGLHGQVDALLNELQIPCALEREGGWQFQSDVGPFTLRVEEQSGDLVLLQLIQVMERRPKQYADAMHGLLVLNFEAEGARFAAGKDGNKDILVLTSRLHAGEVRAESFERMLEQAMRLSRRLDVVVGNAPAQPAAATGTPASALPPPQGAPVARAQPRQQAQPAAQPRQQPAAQGAGSPPANWYPDPHRQARLRYWDGSRWTEHTAQ